MSYPYRITVAKSVEQGVTKDDAVSDQISLTPILDEEAMRALLKEALEKRGFQEKDGKLERSNADGSIQSVDLESLEVTTRLELEGEIKKSQELEIIGDAYSEEQRERQQEKHRVEAEERLEKKLKITEAEVAAKQQELLAEIGDKLAASEAERRRELHEAVSEVYAEALKKKAARLGTVMSIEENRSADGNDYELTIKITE